MPSAGAAGVWGFTNGLSDYPKMPHGARSASNRLNVIRGIRDRASEQLVGLEALEPGNDSLGVQSSVDASNVSKADDRDTSDVPTRVIEPGQALVLAPAPVASVITKPTGTT